ncbi:DUF6624 domain-containing protein [Streptomyces sp. NRRL F-5053]|uniref:DUF6624 domain-containing protein n=1 Tax=Streptomyces sp. NRRL F-5053 TaxID=1463854 RepID=UPI0004CC8BA9|nr:DUF6624 domain-containing protein [Streptomyces sp. NRRL F-5053]
MTDRSAPRCPGLAADLLRRMAADQYARGVREDGPDAEPDFERMRAVDADNAAALQHVLAEYGWPGRSLVGERAAHAAWLLAQHAGPDLQSRALNLLDEAVKQGEATPVQWAFLLDRCRMQQGQPQLYGTQYQDLGDGRGVRLWDVADPADLDRRRREVGLGPHAEYDAALRSRR